MFDVVVPAARDDAGVAVVVVVGLAWLALGAALLLGLEDDVCSPPLGEPGDMVVREVLLFLRCISFPLNLASKTSQFPPAFSDDLGDTDSPRHAAASSRVDDAKPCASAAA